MKSKILVSKRFNNISQEINNTNWGNEKIKAVVDQPAGDETRICIYMGYARIIEWRYDCSVGEFYLNCDTLSSIAYTNFREDWMLSESPVDEMKIKFSIISIIWMVIFCRRMSKHAPISYGISDAGKLFSVRAGEFFNIGKPITMIDFNPTESGKESDSTELSTPTGILRDAFPKNIFLLQAIREVEGAEFLTYLEDPESKCMSGVVYKCGNRLLALQTYSTISLTLKDAEDNKILWKWDFGSLFLKAYDIKEKEGLDQIIKKFSTGKNNTKESVENQYSSLISKLIDLKNPAIDEILKEEGFFKKEKELPKTMEEIDAYLGDKAFTITLSGVPDILEVKILKALEAYRLLFKESDKDGETGSYFIELSKSSNPILREAKGKEVAAGTINVTGLNYEWATKFLQEFRFIIKTLLKRKRDERRKTKTK